MASCSRTTPVGWWKLDPTGVHSEVVKAFEHEYLDLAPDQERQDLLRAEFLRTHHILMKFDGDCVFRADHTYELNLENGVDALSTSGTWSQDNAVITCTALETNIDLVGGSIVLFLRAGRLWFADESKAEAFKMCFKTRAW